MIFIVTCLFLLFPFGVFAANINDPGGILDNAANLYKSQITVWYSGFKSVAVSLLSLLMAINIVWRFGTLLYRGNQFNDMLFELMRTVAIFCFFLWLINSFSDWTEAIFSGFINLADLAYSDWTVYGTASGMVDNGVQAFKDILDKVQPVEIDGFGGTIVNAFVWCFSMLLALVFGGISLALWAYIGVNLAIQYVTFYFLTYAGVIFLGLAGSDWTRNSALNYLNAVLAGAIRYFATILIAAMSCKVFQEVVASFSAVQSQHGFSFIEGLISPLVTLTLASFFAYKFSTVLPDRLASLINPATGGIGVSAGGFSQATGLGRAAKNLAGAATALTIATGAMAGKAMGSAASASGDALSKALSNSGHNAAASAFDNTRAAVGAVGETVGKGLSAAGSAVRSGLSTAAHLSGQDKLAAGLAFTNRMGLAGLRNGLVERYGEKGADDKLDELSTLGRNFTYDAAAKGMSPSAAADYGFTRACSEMGINPNSGHSSSVENTISAGRPDPDAPVPNFASNTNANIEENGMQNFRDVNKDPIEEDPVTDKNFFDPADKWKNS